MVMANRQAGVLLAATILSTLGCGAAHAEVAATSGTDDEEGAEVETTAVGDVRADDAPPASDPELSFSVENGRIVAQPGGADLGPASGVRALGILDLCGPAPVGDTEVSYGAERSLSQPPVARRALPVAVLAAQHVNGDQQSTEILLVSLRGTPVRLVSTTVSSRSPSAGGISADWRMREAVEAGFPLRIQVVGRALPGEGGGMPGPQVVEYAGIASPVCAAADPTSAAIAAVSTGP